jgi:hypothetical protein
MHLTNEITPTPDEPCVVPAVPSIVPAAPAQFVDPANEFRLTTPLRKAAQTFDSHEILARAAVAYLSVASHAADPQLGDALADLAVTGRKSYQHFKSHHTPEQIIKQLTSAKLAQMPSIVATPNDVATAVHRALTRAYTVAWAIRGPADRRAAIRAQLGWLAVSGEDDSPHRPVNIAAPPHEQ